MKFNCVSKEQLHNIVITTVQISLSITLTTIYSLQ